MVFRTPCFHGQGCGFSPCSGNEDPPGRVSQPKERKKETRRCQVSLPGLRVPVVPGQKARGEWRQYRWVESPLGPILTGPHHFLAAVTDKLLASLFLSHLL